MTVKAAISSVELPPETLRGQGSNLHEPVSRTGELPITRPRTGARRRARTADLRTTRAMLWPPELARQTPPSREIDSHSRQQCSTSVFRVSFYADDHGGMGGGPRSCSGRFGRPAGCLLTPLPAAYGPGRTVLCRSEMTGESTTTRTCTSFSHSTALFEAIATAEYRHARMVLPNWSRRRASCHVPREHSCYC